MDKNLFTIHVKGLLQALVLAVHSRRSHQDTLFFSLHCPLSIMVLYLLKLFPLFKSHYTVYVKERPLDNRGYRANRSKKYSKRYILFGEKTLPL